MVKLKSPSEIEKMAQGGRILGGILSHLKKKAQEGVTTREIDEEAEKEILKSGGQPSFKMVPNYRFSTCLCVNEEVVHGLPSDYHLKRGDLLGIDIGLFYQGFHTDMAQTIIIGEKSLTASEISEKKKFLSVGQEALEKTIQVSQEGNHLGHISQTIQEIIEESGYAVVRALVGHGIGRKLHEDPQVPGFLSGEIEKTPLLKKGMTLAIEVIYNMGGAEVVYRNDGWTIASQDGSLSGLFEKTIAVDGEKPIVLTV